jgi:DNA-binding NarL/FixJ family response regulator
MNKKVLIVEDDHLIAYIMARYIAENTDYKVLGPVDNADEAIEVALRELPICILMDIRIDGKMDGIDAAIAINKVQDVPIIYTSGNSDAKTVGRANQTNLLGFLSKPVNREELVRLLNTIQPT